jgi:hypothetical protein
MCPLCRVASPALEVPKCSIPHFQFNITVEAICEAGHMMFESLRDDFPEMFTDLEGKPLAPGDYSGAAKALCGLLEWTKLERDRARKDAEFWMAKEQESRMRVWKYKDHLAGRTTAGLEAQLDQALKKL